MRSRGKAILPLRLPVCLLATLAGTVGTVCTTFEAKAQAASADSSLPPIASTPQFTGSDFAGQRFPLAPSPGKATFSAKRIWSWEEGDSRRLFLGGDARISLGDYEFDARNASVWMKDLGTQNGKQTYQFFVALDRAGGSNAPSTIGVSSDQLGIRAVIAPDSPVSLTTDIIISETIVMDDAGKGRPDERLTPDELTFEKTAREMLARSLTRLTNPDAGRFAISPPPYVPALRLKNPPPTPDPVPASRIAGVTPQADPRPTATSGSVERLPSRPLPQSPSRANPATPAAAASTITKPAATSEPSTAASGAPTAAAVAADNETTRNVTSSNVTAESTTPAANVAPQTLPPGTPRPQPVATSLPANVQPGQNIFAPSGILTLLARDISVVKTDGENAVVASNGIAVQYNDTDSGRMVQLTAQRAVIFLEPGDLQDAARLSVKDVRGMFLEGDVTASDGKYTLRGPQIYYDLRANRAVMLDAVFWTYDERRQLPLYVRAKSIQQTAADQFVAESAILTNTALLDPELSIGASSVTITRTNVPAPQSPLDVQATGRGTTTDGSGTTGLAGAAAGTEAPTQSAALIDARNITLRAAGVPVFWWPAYSGDPALTPIKDLRVENRSGSGAAVKATLNAYSLLGLSKPKDIGGDLLLDYYFERGPGVGTRWTWNQPGSKGSIFAYMVPIDSGTDLLKPGTEIERDDEFRGLIVGEERWRLDDKWQLFAEGSYISDETFIDAFFEDQGETRREFTNRLRADRTENNTALSIEAKGNFNDFLANEYLLQSQGYAVNKLPEGVYSRQADDVLSETNPGLLSYWSEYRAGALQLSLDEIRPNQRGFTTSDLSNRAFGLDPTQSYSDRLRAQGLSEETIFRADTRQELTLNAKAGAVNIQPFVVGRITAYDTGFELYSPQDDDSTRLWGAAGVRASTTFQRVYDGVDSNIFDVHRLRHIVEPNITIWHAGTSVESAALPVYDESVEALADGTIMKFGATQTFQTQRGGPGRWHTTDFFVLSTDFVVSSGDTDQRTPIGRFFDYRPEYANPGNYFVGDAVMRLTDATAIAAGTVYDFDQSEQAMSNAGIIVQHAANFSTSAEVRYINALESTYINLGAAYDLTTKYALNVNAAYDVDISGFQSTNFEIRRKFASVILGVSVDYNDITGETGFGFVIRPYGATGEARFAGGEQSNFGS
jgi:hypothetical protein